MAAQEEDARWEEQEARILDATGTDFEDIDHHTSILDRINVLRRELALTVGSSEERLTTPEEHWEECVLVLEMLCDVWKWKWDGMSDWDEFRRTMQVSLLVLESDRREYEEHVDFGLMLLHASRMLFSWVEGIRVPDDVASVLRLSRRATNVAVVVSIGLEWLRVDWEFWALVKSVQAQ
jgi:hypothetical protein